MVELDGEVPGLQRTLVVRVVERLLDLEPGLIAVLLTGSYAKGTAIPTSDLDLVALTASIPRTEYRMWFEERRNGPPLHVSAGATTPSGWLARRDSPARWSFGFPAINEANYLWGATQATALLGESPSLMHPPARPELEDFIEFVLKAKTCAKAGDDLGLRSFAQAAASLAPSLLISINAERIVSDRRDALDAALSLPIAPANYRRDVTICLGLAQVSATDVRTAIASLGRELLAFLRQRAADIDPQPDIGRYLADGTLEQHLGLVE